MRNILQIIDELILMWWKPRGKNDNTFNCGRNQDKTGFVLISDFKESDMLYFKITDLVRRESGFWKFITDKGLYVRTPGVTTAYQELNNILWENKHWPVLYKDREEYWLIESALCDADKLEEFIDRSVMTKDKIKEGVDGYIRWIASAKIISNIIDKPQDYIEKELKKIRDTYELWTRRNEELTQQEERFINIAISRAIDKMLDRSDVIMQIEEGEI